MATEGDESESHVYRWALSATGLVLAVIAVTSVAVAGAVRGTDGVWSALAGVAVATASGMVTQAAMIVGHRREPLVFVSIVGGAWLAKMFVIVIGLFWLGGLEGIDRGTFGTVTLVGVGATLAVDLFAVRRARISYTGSSSGGDRS
ncbi:MAG: hypothetical protein CVT68_05420 [Actinobacteria bacterium HGW-Actinobacteria-8]|nr:MAG: hypothetical protein CVT68_05420 [Actinobacteria bacterium HGW-Actinobacteria-8]